MYDKFRHNLIAIVPILGIHCRHFIFVVHTVICVVCFWNGNYRSVYLHTTISSQILWIDGKGGGSRALIVCTACRCRNRNGICTCIYHGSSAIGNIIIRSLCQGLCRVCKGNSNCKAWCNGISCVFGLLYCFCNGSRGKGTFCYGICCGRHTSCIVAHTGNCNRSGISGNCYHRTVRYRKVLALRQCSGIAVYCSGHFISWKHCCSAGIRKIAVCRCQINHTYGSQINRSNRKVLYHLSGIISVTVYQNGRCGLICCQRRVNIVGIGYIIILIFLKNRCSYLYGRNRGLNLLTSISIGRRCIR